MHFWLTNLKVKKKLTKKCQLNLDRMKYKNNLFETKECVRGLREHSKDAEPFVFCCGSAKPNLSI